MLPATAAAAERDPDEAFTFTPAVLFVPDAVAGGLVETRVRVQNQSTVDAAFIGEVYDARSGARGSTALELLPIGDSPRGAGAWVRASPQRFTLAAGAERTVRVTIRPPADAGAGGHYAGIAFTALPTAPAGQIDVRPRAEVPVLITVRGDYRRELRVHVEVPSRWRWHGGAARWRVTLHNAGDVHENVSGTLELDGLLSPARSSSLKPGILLPDERRTQQVTVDLRDAPDVLVARARLVLDSSPAVRAASSRTYVVPWWLVVLLAVTAVVVAWRIRSRAPSGSPAVDDDPGEPYA